METASFLTWLTLVTVVAGVGIGAMIYAYQGAGSLSILFEQPIPIPAALPDSQAGTEAAVQFQQGYNAFGQKNYRQAINHFIRAIQQVSTLAEAYHNCGLAYANLRQDDDSVVYLLTASELYGEQGKGEQLSLLKHHLEAIRERKLARQGE